MITHLILDRADSRTIDQDLLCLLIKLNFLNDHPSTVKRRKKFIILSGSLGHCHLELYFSFLINKDLYKPVVISRTIKLPNVIYLEDLIKEFNTLPAKGVQLVNTLQRLPATGKNIPQVVFDLVSEIIMGQAKNGDSFVICLPGIRELYLLKHRISRLDYIKEKLILRVSLLHQMSTWAEQEEIFKFDPRQVNVILTTSFENIILLPRVKYVIDLGLERVCNFDLKRGMNVMVTSWTNRSSLRQRESQGLSDIVIRVFSKHTYEALQEQGIPEMRRSRLSYVLLRMKEKMHKLGQIETLCQRLPDPPTSIALKQAMKYLNDTGAIVGHSLNAITLNEVGRLALRLSVDADVSRLILLGLRLCCSVESVIIAAGLTLPVELFTKPQIFQLGSSEEFEHELGYITGRRLYDMGKHNDMMIFCSVYCKWLNESSWDKEWIHETFVNVDSLHSLLSRVQFLASGLKRFLEEEGVMKAMEGEYQKLVELSMVDDNHQSCNRSWIFCSNFNLILLTIAAAFSSSIISGTIPNPMLAEKESLQITALGLDPDRTFKISNVPAELLANFEDFQKTLLVLGPISKVLALEGTDNAFVECNRSSNEEFQPHTLPIAAQNAYFFSDRKSGTILSLPSKRGTGVESTCIGKVSRDRQIAWSAFVKGRRYGITFDGHSSLPQVAFGSTKQEHFIAVAASFTGAENTKIHVSASALIPFEDYFSLVVLLLVRPFENYPVRLDSTKKYVYSLQHGPLEFNMCPQYLLVEQLYLIEKVRKMLNLRAPGVQSCEDNIVQEVLNLIQSVACQKDCEPHLNPTAGPWLEFPSLELCNMRQTLSLWKWNILPEDSSRNEYSHETEESILLRAFKSMEPGLTEHYLEEWLNGNADLNNVFYSLLERIVTDPGYSDQTYIILKYVHKRCDELMPKKKKIQVERWFYSFCNPFPDDLSIGESRGLGFQKIQLPMPNGLEAYGWTQNSTDDQKIPIISKTLSLTPMQMNNLRKKIEHNPHQATILLPKSQSQTESVVVFGHSTEVEMTMEWIDRATRISRGKYEFISQTHFIPNKEMELISFDELATKEIMYRETHRRGNVQFSIQNCSGNYNPPNEISLDFGEISREIKKKLQNSAESMEFEIQAKLGRVIFTCSEDMKRNLPFGNSQPLKMVLHALERRSFKKNHFADSVAKTDYLYIKACLRLLGPVPVNCKRKISVFLKDPIDLGNSRKITIEDNPDEPGHFQLSKVQHVEKLAVIDFVILRMDHVKSDIRIIVQGLRHESIEERYRDFASKTYNDGIKLKFPKGSFLVDTVRTKCTEEYSFGDFLVSISEITQTQGTTRLQKYEVEVSPIYQGRSLFSVLQMAEHLEEFVCTVLTYMQSVISSQLFLCQPSSSSSALAHAILRLWKSGQVDASKVNELLDYHTKTGSFLSDRFQASQKQERKFLSHKDLGSLVLALWKFDGLYFDNIHLSETLVCYLFKAMQSLSYSVCKPMDSNLEELIFSDGFPPRIALDYVSFLQGHCFNDEAWERVLNAHLSILLMEDPSYIQHACQKNLGLLHIITDFKANVTDPSLKKLCVSLRRHWATKNPLHFLRIYDMALKRHQASTNIRQNLEEFVKTLFRQSPDDAPMFIFRLVYCYMYSVNNEKIDNSQMCTSLLNLLNLIQELKLIITENCRTSALSMLISLDNIDEHKQIVENKVFEVYDIDVSTFRHCHYHMILSKFLPLKADHVKELERRGFTTHSCQRMGFKSWTPGKRVPSSSLIPGLNKKGRTLIGSVGIFVPARDPFGHIVGAQIKVDCPTNGKYKWLSSNKVFDGGKGPHIDGELPLFCCTSLFSNTSILGMCEGGLKAHALSFLGSLPVIGASGAAFLKSRRLLEKYLAVINPQLIIFFPDAGSQCNDQVIRCYFHTFRLMRDFGYPLLVAWWGQVNKVEHEDIDDLLCNGIGKCDIPLLSTYKFWHILHPAVTREIAYEFPEYSGFYGSPDNKNEERLLDRDGIEISKVVSMQGGDNCSLFQEYLIMIPKKVIKCMPSAPNDLLTPQSVSEFLIEVKVVSLSDSETVDCCVDWVSEHTMKSTAYMGLVCYYDSEFKICLIVLCTHARCVIVQIPMFINSCRISCKLQDLLSDPDVAKGGIDIARDSLHMFFCLHLTANNCIKLSLQTNEQRKHIHLTDMFRKLFEWEWCEKDEIKHSNWRTDLLRLEQIKFAALSAWSSHLILALSGSSSNRPKSFHINGVQGALLKYFHRCFMNIDASDSQSLPIFKLEEATVEIQDGYLILNLDNIRSNILNSRSVLNLKFENGRASETYTTKKMGNMNVLQRSAASLQNASAENVGAINEIIVDNSASVALQRQKVQDAIYTVLCNPEVCPQHILMSLGCIAFTRPQNPEKLCVKDKRLNRSQSTSLSLMLSSPLSAVIGPPGTGKTRLISAVANQWGDSTGQEEMLLCTAQQNVAVRHMAETIISNNVKGVMILVSHEYYTDTRQEAYEQIADYIVVSGPSTVAQVTSWISRNKRSPPRILLCTLALIGSASFRTCVKNRKITYMIVDESSQAAEQCLLTSLICLPHLRRLSVLGDPNQLPPFGKSVLSVFDLVAKNCPVNLLDIQYRMPHDIANFVSREFYESKLKTGKKYAAGNEIANSFLWVDVCGSPSTAVGSTSLCNGAEAEAVVKLCKLYTMVEAAGMPSSVSSSPSSLFSSSSKLSVSTSLSPMTSLKASILSSSSSEITSSASLTTSSSAAKLVVLTLYEAQRFLIDKMLTDNEIHGVSVHNVDAFQGQEAETVIISLVVGAKMSPFARDRRRACVLLSRVKSMLYICGNFKAIRECRRNGRDIQEKIIWESLALECEEKNRVVPSESFLGS
ncbi:hypothetical protein KP509_35G005800 [Ceratopteris richardii]|nr:hypothetical protein KP509_35G005800 [Ceratopteris richardii]